MEMSTNMKYKLEEYYQLTSCWVEQRTGGWSAFAFYVEAVQAKCFLKVYDKRRASSARWIDGLKAYIPVVEWLYQNTPLKEHIIHTVYTVTGAPYAEDEDFVYLLSEFIPGEVIGDSILKEEQVAELARLLALLHKSTLEIPEELLSGLPKEDYDTTFCNDFQEYLQEEQKGYTDEFDRLIFPYMEGILNLINKFRTLSMQLRDKTQNLVQCHTDSHNYNLLQGKKLVLIDWEGLKLAPQEQDMILHWNKPYAQQFLSEYKRFRDCGVLDLEALEFYELKRLLEDIWEWIKDLKGKNFIKSEELTIRLLRLNLESCRRFTAFDADVI